VAEETRRSPTPLRVQATHRDAGGYPQPCEKPFQLLYQVITEGDALGQGLDGARIEYIETPQAK
jgi:hypothetical protein